MTDKARIIDKAKEKSKKLELYRLIDQGYKAMQEKRETSIDDVVRKLEQRRANRS